MSKPPIGEPPSFPGEPRPSTLEEAIEMLRDLQFELRILRAKHEALLRNVKAATKLLET